MFTRKRLVNMFIPLCIEQLLSITIGLIDTLMASNISEAAVSAVSLVDTVNVVLQQIIYALVVGGSIVASQYIGTRDLYQAKKAANQVVSLSIIVSCTLSVIVLVARNIILNVCFPDIEPDVLAYANTYFMITALSYPFFGLYNAGSALFRVQGNTKISMFVNVVMNVVNIIGNYLMINTWNMEVAGTALSTLLARLFAFLTVFIFLQHRNSPLRIDHLKDLKPQGEIIKKILSLGVPGAIESGMFQVGKLLISSVLSTLGTASITANAVANHVTAILYVPSDTIDNSITTIVGQTLGSGDKEKAYKYAKRLLLASIVGMVTINILGIFVLDKFIIGWFTLSEESIAIASKTIFWSNVAQILVWPLAFSTPFILKAGGDAKFTMITSMSVMWAVRVTLSYVLVNVFHMGLLGIWTAMFIDWVFRAAVYIPRLFSKKWMEHKIV